MVMQVRTPTVTTPTIRSLYAVRCIGTWSFGFIPALLSIAPACCAVNRKVLNPGHRSARDRSARARVALSRKALTCRLPYATIRSFAGNASLERDIHSP